MAQLGGPQCQILYAMFCCHTPLSSFNHKATPSPTLQNGRTIVCSPFTIPQASSATVCLPFPLYHIYWLTPATNNTSQLRKKHKRILTLTHWNRTTYPPARTFGHMQRRWNPALSLLELGRLSARQVVARAAKKTVKKVREKAKACEYILGFILCILYWGWWWSDALIHIAHSSH
jgi:hypothetical protein